MIKYDLGELSLWWIYIFLQMMMELSSPLNFNTPRSFIYLHWSSHIYLKWWSNITLQHFTSDVTFHSENRGDAVCRLVLLHAKTPASNKVKLTLNLSAVRVKGGAINGHWAVRLYQAAWSMVCTSRYETACVCLDFFFSVTWACVKSYSRLRSHTWVYQMHVCNAGVAPPE